MMRALPLCFIAAVALGGCDHTHLSKNFGQSTRSALKAQVINPAAGDRHAQEQGLDPEEAAIVSKGYRDSLSPKQQETSRTPLIVLPSQQPGVMPPLPVSPPPGTGR